MLELRTWFQTTIPKSKLIASHGIERISDPRLAVVTAFIKLQTSRVAPLYQPRLISVEQLDFETALDEDRVQEEDRDQWNGQQLWLVVFEGEFTTISPDSGEWQFQRSTEVLLPEDASGIRVAWSEER